MKGKYSFISKVSSFFNKLWSSKPDSESEDDNPLEITNSYKKSIEDIKPINSKLSLINTNAVVLSERKRVTSERPLETKPLEIKKPQTTLKKINKSAKIRYNDILLKRLKNEKKIKDDYVVAILQNELEKQWRGIMEYMDKKFKEEKVAEEILVDEILKHEELVDKVLDSYETQVIEDNNLLSSYGLDERLLKQYGITEEKIKKKIAQKLDNIDYNEYIEDTNKEHNKEQVEEVKEIKEQSKYLNRSIFDQLEEQYKNKLIKPSTTNVIFQPQKTTQDNKSLLNQNLRTSLF